MATDLERLVLSIEANTKSLEKGLKRVESKVDGTMGRASKSTKTFSTALASAQKAAVGLAAAFVTVEAARKVQQLIDTATGIKNALKVAGLEGENLTKVYDSLFASAQKNAAPLDALVTLYSRASQSAADLGASQEDLLNFTDKIALALRVSGQSATESAGALLQLSQALGNGVVQAEEYNSLLDGGRTILQATAAGLKEAGGSVSALTRLVKSGKVSSEAFFRAFLAGAPILEEKVASAEQTISQHLARLQNVLIDTAGKFDDTTEAGQLLGGAIDQITTEINNVNFDKLAGEIDFIIKKIAEALGALDRLSESSGLGSIGKFLTGGRSKVDLFEGTPFEGTLVITSTKAVQDRINGAFDNAGGSNSGGLTPEAIRAAIGGGDKGIRPSAVPVPTARPDAGAGPDQVTLADYPIKPSGGGGRKGGGGAGGTSEAEKQKKAIDDVVASLKFEQDQLGRTDEEQRLYNELKQAGVDRTSVAGQQIETLVTQIEKQKAAMESARELSDLFGNSIVDALSGIISGSTSAEDALKGLVQQLARAALQASLLGEGPLAGIFGTSGGGGILGAIFGGFRASGGPVSAGTAYEVGEKGRELFIPRTSGTIIPNSALQPPSIRSAPANGNQPVSINVNVEGANGDQHVISLVRQGVSQGLNTYDKQLTGTFGSRMSRAQQRQI